MTVDGTVVASVGAGVAVDSIGNGNVASTSTDNVVTYDTTGPTITVSDLTVNTDPGKAGATVTFDVTTSSTLRSYLGIDAITGAVAAVCTPPSGSFFPIGTTLVTCTATDLVGNTSTATFNVIVLDKEPPVIPKPADVATISAGAGVPITFATPSATDNSGTATVVCSPVSGSTFNIGTTVVTCTASDPSGNTSATTFEVVVRLTVVTLPATGGGLGALGTALRILLAGLVLLGLSQVGRRRRLGGN
jgi:hypothetical protein